MAAPIGNNYNMKWKTPEERKAACDLVCEHLSRGLSQDCFVPAAWKTVEWYIKEFPEDFPSEKIEAARRQGQIFWEGMGVDGAMGQIMNFNATTWIFNMKNRYSWKDKSEHSTDPNNPLRHEHSGKVDLNLNDAEAYTRMLNGGS